MRFDNRSANRQADSHPIPFGREEALEELRQMIWSDTRAGILNLGAKNSGTQTQCPDSMSALCALAHRLHRIHREIREWCCRKLPEKCSFTGLLPFIVGISARQIPDIAAISGIRGGGIRQLGVIGGRQGLEAISQICPVRRRSGADQLANPVFGVARHCCDASKHRDAHTERQQPRGEAGASTVSATCGPAYPLLASDARGLR
jgi:hypothetical protein